MYLYKEQHHLASANREYLQSALKNAEQALNGIKAAKAKDDEELKTLRDKVNKFTNLEEEVKLFKTQPFEKSKAADRLPIEQNKLSDAKNTIGTLEAKIQKMEADKPGIRQRAVNRYLNSAAFIERLQDRFDDGWTAAQRCVAHAASWTKSYWAKVEDAFINKAHAKPSGFEQQQFTDEDILNTAPAETGATVDPSILNSPVA